MMNEKIKEERSKVEVYREDDHKHYEENVEKLHRFINTYYDSYIYELYNIIYVNYLIILYYII